MDAKENQELAMKIAKALQDKFPHIGERTHFLDQEDFDDASTEEIAAAILEILNKESSKRMKFDLCIGDGEIFWEFKDVSDRDKVWTDLIASPGWKAEWAEKRGDETSARSHIVIHASKMPLSYRWKCIFEK